MKAYAAYYDHEIRMDSSSGGIFSLIAGEFEVIYGAALTEDCHDGELRRMKGDFSPLRGSKYFQVKVGDTFRQAKNDLEEGRTVLFTGTGCQINGLKKYLQKDYSNLLTVDVICHGVPSQKLWDAYARYREKQFGRKLKKVNFRCKDGGVSSSCIRKHQVYTSKYSDPYMQMFLQDYSLRPSCYQCYAKKMKLSDLSIGDFWGIESVAPEINDGMGISLVVIRTEKGKALFEKLKPYLRYAEVDYEACIQFNPAENQSVDRPRERDTIFVDLCRISFRKLCKMYGIPLQNPTIENAKRSLQNVLRKPKKHIPANSEYGLLLQFEK